jgi:lipoprotein-anchoring transpeptidase ErfK/SrfK
MKHPRITILHVMCATAALCLAFGPTVGPAYASEEHSYVVRPGDTLIGIAVRHGVSPSQLAHANGLRWNSWVYVGQRLTIPGHPSSVTPPSASSTYVVRPGDTLTRIAARHGVGVSSLARANGLRWYAWVYVGQRLTIPGATRPPDPHPSGERWIDVNLSTQTLTASQGAIPVRSMAVSTGLPATPTPVGQFRIWIKLRADDMSGPGYTLPDVPYVMYFYRGYGLHGTYWHTNFGAPMSHGCVNLSTADAGWLFKWASVGTKVVTHT